MAESGIPTDPLEKARRALGSSAHEALHDLCDTREWTEKTWGRWRSADSLAFYGCLYLELEASDVQSLLDEDKHEDEIGELNRLMVSYKTALPFSEAEREWLFNIVESEDRPHCLAAIRARKPEVIVSSGLRRVLYGRELLRKWWSWSRDTDEFSGQGTLDIAREALQHMNEKYAPHHGLPGPLLETARRK